jgi:hypothetical protein
MTKNKKPTMMQVKNVCDNLIKESIVTRRGVEQLDYILWNYIEFNQNEDRFKEFLKNKVKKNTNLDTKKEEK